LTKEIENHIRYTMIKDQIEAVKQYLIENWDSPDSEEICDILGIDKTKTISLDVVIKGSVSVEVPLTYNADDLNYLSADISFDFNDGDVDTLDVDLDVKQITNTTDW